MRWFLGFRLPFPFKRVRPGSRNQSGALLILNIVQSWVLQVASDRVLTSSGGSPSPWFRARTVSGSGSGYFVTAFRVCLSCKATFVTWPSRDDVKSYTFLMESYSVSVLWTITPCRWHWGEWNTSVPQNSLVKISPRYCALLTVGTATSSVQRSID